jgi:hypothetical protein
MAVAQANVTDGSMDYKSPILANFGVLLGKYQETQRLTVRCPRYFNNNRTRKT